MPTPKLYMLLIGATPPGRHTEQHDVYFSIGNDIRDLLPEVASFWPETNGRFHLDAWREVSLVNGYSIRVAKEPGLMSATQLFFINLGGYKKGEFEEFHYKMLVAAPEKGEAIRQAKDTAFYRHTGFKGATSHIDNKYGVDVDDIFAIPDILPGKIKERYSLLIEPSKTSIKEDELYLGYFKPDTVEKWAPPRKE